jgi:hypothetical protein
MEWTVLLPVIVSAAVICLLYLIPPPWVKRYMGAVDDFKELLSPTALGDAVHHAVTKNDAEVMQIAGEYANGAIHEAIPAFTEKLANEAVGLVASMYTSGVAKDMGKASGAARGYLQLPSIQKQALKTGVESMGTGMLGGLLPPEIASMITPEMIQSFMSGLLTPGGNGAQAPAGNPQGPNQNAAWRPPV